MTARSRWVIGGSSIVLVIVAIAFLGTTRNRNSVQARGIPFDSATATVAFASPGRVEGASETTQVGAAADGILKAVYVKEGQFVKRGTLLGEIGCDELQASLQTGRELMQR
jgi:multidrug efflux pump subunit AcrA (membrane-fusion protein)